MPRRSKEKFHIKSIMCTIFMLSDVNFLTLADLHVFPFLAGMYGYHGKRIQDFLRITMAMPRLIAPAKRLLEQGFKFGSFPVQNYQSFEANIDFEIRCVGSPAIGLRSEISSLSYVTFHCQVHGGQRRGRMLLDRTSQRQVQDA